MEEYAYCKICNKKVSKANPYGYIEIFGTIYNLCESCTEKIQNYIKSKETKIKAYSNNVDIWLDSKWEYKEPEGDE